MSVYIYIYIQYYICLYIYILYSIIYIYICMNELIKGVQYFVLAVLTLAACPRRSEAQKWTLEGGRPKNRLTTFKT